MRVRVFAAYWQANDIPKMHRCFQPRHVARLRDNLKRFQPEAVFSLLADAHLIDDELRAACDEVTPFDGSELPGFGRLLEWFNPRIAWEPWEGRRIAVGLDTVFTGSLDWLAEWDEAPVGLPRDPSIDWAPCSGVATWDRAGAEIVWRLRETMAPDAMRRGDFICDLTMLRVAHAEHGWPFLEDRPERVLSHPVHVATRGNHDGASVVYFHGAEKPWHLPAGDPVRKIWGGDA